MVKTNKVLVICTIALAIMNVALVWNMNQSSNLGQPLPPLPPNVGFKFEVMKTLHFDEEQSAVYDEMTKRHHEAMVQVEEQRSQLLAAYFNSLLNDVEVDTTTFYAELESLEKQRISITYNHFEEIKSLCSEDQLDDYKKIVSKAVKRLLTQQDNPRPRAGRH